MLYWALAIKARLYVTFPSCGRQDYSFELSLGNKMTLVLLPSNSLCHGPKTQSFMQPPDGSITVNPVSSKSVSQQAKTKGCPRQIS